MFSSRTPSDLAPNAFAQAVAAARAAGRTVFDLTESNPTRAGFAYPPDLLSGLASAAALVYEPSPFGLAEARGAVAREFERRGRPVAADRIVLTASTSEAYAMLFKLLADAGDEVLAPRPSYPLFDHLTRLEQVRPLPYELEYDGTWRIDVGDFERSLTSRTRAVLIVSPNNPTGSFVKAGELDRMVALCAARDIALVGDEVFADYELEPGARAAAGPVAGRGEALTFSLGGLSKSIGLPQVKLAWIGVSGPERLVSRALERLELICDTYLSVSTPVQVAASDLLERGAAIRTQIGRRVSSNYQHLRARVREASGCRALPSEGGWYAVLQVPSLEPEEALVLDLVRTAGVLVHPGYFFDFPRESYLILSLLPREACFVEGLERVLDRFEVRCA